MTPNRLCHLLAAFLFLTPAAASADGREEKIINTKPDKTWAQVAGNIFASGKSVAVVIAISNYMGGRDGYPSLATAKDDAEKMVQFLLNYAGFDTVYILTDEKATKSKIDSLMTDEIPSILGPNDRFLFYWSGHGDQMVTADKQRAFGFLPLANSKVKQFSAMISMDDISRWDSYLSSRHALFVLDSCLSGLAGVEKKGVRDGRLEQLSQPAHQLVTAGTAKESVISGEKWTGSLFTDSLILGAKGEASRPSGIVSLYSLVDYIQMRVAVEKEAAKWSNSLTPQFRNLRAGDGAFFFASPSALVPDKPRLDSTVARVQPPVTKGAPTPAVGGLQTFPTVSRWIHNSSTMLLTVDGKDIKFSYLIPRPGIQAEGVKSGTLLFTGERSDDRLIGTAFVFDRRCAQPFPYKVSGDIMNGTQKIVMSGQAPNEIDFSSCKPRGAYRSDTLVFDRIN